MPDSLRPSPVLQDYLQRCNRSELYQVCRKAGLVPPTGASRALLIDYLLGNVEGEKEPTSIDLWRNGLKGFVEANWAVLQPQLTCPIRANIDACYGCLDTQVMACVEEQGHYGSLIQIRRKDGR